MSITLSEAITEVRSILNEASPAFWTDAEITSWIKEGVRITASKTLMAETEDTIDPLVADQLAYSSTDEIWIADIIEPYAAIYNDASNGYKGLIKIHPRQIGNVATFTSGPPKYYAIHNRLLYFWPLTSSVEVAAGATIQMLYATETDDITVLKDEFQNLPVDWAAARAKQKDQKFAEANSLFGQFYNGVNFEREDKHVRETDSVESFRVPKRGGGQGAKG
jgi:hypothetical protein